MKSGDKFILLDFHHERHIRSQYLQPHGRAQYFWVSAFNQYIGKQVTLNRRKTDTAWSLEEFGQSYGFEIHWLGPITELHLPEELFEI